MTPNRFLSQHLLRTATKFLGPVTVLDLETRFDPLLVGLTTSTKSANVFAQRIVSCAILKACEPSIGTWEVDSLTSHSDHEEDVLAAIDAALATPTTLVTYNGIRHDLPVIRRRIMRFRRFDLQYAAASRLDHLDLYECPTVPPGGVAGSLQDRCASLGIDSKTYLEADEDERPRAVLKGETDVVATFVLLLHELAALRGDGRVWASGMDALRQADHGALRKKGHLRRIIG